MAEAAVYRGMSQAELDRDYSPRVLVPDFQTVIDRWDAQCEIARKSIKNELDVAYGPAPAEKLDIYYPDRAGPHPVLLYFHGGGWRARSKVERAFLATPLTQAGVMLVNAGYTLLPVQTMDELVGQCRRAVAWVAGHIAAHGGDPKRLFIAGESAGGHLVAELAATDWTAAGFDPAPPVKGALAISGIYDLEPIWRTSTHGDLGLTEEQAKRNSPIHHVRKTPTQTILAVGLDESAEFRRQMDDYSAAMAKAGIRHDLVRCGGANHYTILDRLCDPRDMLYLSLMRLMRP